jgi:hypothetical protein
MYPQPVADDSSSETQSERLNAPMLTSWLPSYDSRTNRAIPQDILSKKLSEPYTKAQPFRSSPTNALSRPTVVTCSSEHAA